MTMKVDWKLSTTLNSIKDYGLTFEGVNLLDEKVYDPEVLFGNFNEINLRPGIGFYAGAYVRF